MAPDFILCISSSLPETGFLTWLETPEPYALYFTTRERNITLFLYFYLKGLWQNRLTLPASSVHLASRSGSWKHIRTCGGIPPSVRASPREGRALRSRVVTRTAAPASLPFMRGPRSLFGNAERQAPLQAH